MAAHETSDAATVALIYDGDCGFCTATAHWVQDRAGRPGLVAPWQGLDLAEFGLTSAQAAAAVQWVGSGQRCSGADAVAAALAYCGPGWRALGKLMSIGPFAMVARGLYPTIARNRHRLPGATDACRLNP